MISCMLQFVYAFVRDWSTSSRQRKTTSVSEPRNTTRAGWSKIVITRGYRMNDLWLPRQLTAVLIVKHLFLYIINPQTLCSASTFTGIFKKLRLQPPEVKQRSSSQFPSDSTSPRRCAVCRFSRCRVRVPLPMSKSIQPSAAYATGGTATRSISALSVASSSAATALHRCRLQRLMALRILWNSTNPQTASPMVMVPVLLALAPAAMTSPVPMHLIYTRQPLTQPARPHPVPRHQTHPPSVA